MKSNKKKTTNGLKATILFLVICLVSGFVIGLAAAMAEDYFEGVTFESILSGLRYIGLHYSVHLFIIMIVLSTAVTAGFYFYSKRNTGLWDNEDDEFYSKKIDIPLSRGLFVLNFVNILNFVLIGLYYFGAYQLDFPEKMASGIFVDILYFASVILTSVMQFKIVSLVNYPLSKANGLPASSSS